MASTHLLLILTSYPDTVRLTLKVKGTLLAGATANCLLSKVRETVSMSRDDG